MNQRKLCQVALGRVASTAWGRDLRVISDSFQKSLDLRAATAEVR